MSKKINEILEETVIIDEKEQEKMNQKIQRGIAKNIYSKILIFILIFSCLIYGGYSGYQNYLEKNSFHLDDLELIIDRYNYQRNNYGKEQFEELENIKYYLNSYCEIFLPGYIVKYSGEDIEKEKNTHGVYKVPASFVNYFHVNPEKIYDSLYNYPSDEKISIVDGKIELTQYQKVSTYGNDNFDSFWSSPQAYNEKIYYTDIQKEVHTYPDSAFIEMDLSFCEPMSLEDVLLMQVEYPDSRMVYAITHSYELDHCWTTGISLLFSNSLYCFTRKIEEKYPELYMESSEGEDSVYNYPNQPSKWILRLKSESSRKMYAEKLKKHYQSVLSLLLNNDVLEENEKEGAEYVLQDIQDNPVQVLGIRMFCTKEDALRLLEDERIEDMHIEDAKMSRFE